LLVTYSRAGWLAAAGGLAVWWLAEVRRGRGHVRALALAAVALGAVLVSPVGGVVRHRLAPIPATPIEQSALAERVWLTQVGWETLERHPLLGVGAANFGLDSEREGLQGGVGEPVHVVPLLIVAELGLPGALALAALLLGVARALRRPRVPTAALAACVAVGTLSLFDHYLWTTAAGQVMAWVPLVLLSRPGRTPRRRCASARHDPRSARS
jgi:O-antigen ligase